MGKSVLVSQDAMSHSFSMFFKPTQGNLTRSVSHLEFLSHETEMELLSEIKPANIEVVSRKAVNLKELVQDDTAEVQADSECPLETEKVTR